MIENISEVLSMTHEQAKDVCDLFDRLRKENSKLITGDDYVKNWEWNWYRAMNWEELVSSEVDQGEWVGECDTWRPQAEAFCLEELGVTIFQLPCGMYAQYV